MSTPEQFNLLSCSLDTRTLIEASAGTGKTWNISGLYLRLLLEKKLRVEDILVVTFTKAATAELRERIRTRIVEMLDCLRQGGVVEDAFLTGMAQMLTGEQGRALPELITLLDLALQSFDEAAICTIHSFCQRALAESPFAAGMPFTTEITQDDSQELGEAVNDFWRRNMSQGGLSPSFARYLLDRKDNPEKFQKLLKRHVGKPKARIMWPAAHSMDIEAAQARISDIFAAAKETWTTDAAAIQDLLAGADLKASHNAEKLAGSCEECDKYFFAATRPEKITSGMKRLATSKLAGAIKSGKTAPVHPFFDQMEALAFELPDLVSEVKSALYAERMQLIRALLEQGTEALRESKRAKRMVSYDDLLVNLHSALTDGSSPWLAASLQKRYPVALIDEFQDTDPLQFDIFSKIYSSDDASLFLVGDPKQAIYSFRNADLHTYLQAKHAVQATYTLASNQRSSEGLIAALNSLFTSNQNAFMLPGLAYYPVRFGEKKRMAFADASSPAADLQVWMLPHEDGRILDRAAVRDRATAATASEIARLVSCGAAGEIMLDGRPLAPGDIAVLVRSHSQAARIRDALSARGVSSIEISQQSVFESSDAADVEAALCAIMDPTRLGLVLAALATPLLGCTAAEIDQIAASETRLMSYVERFAKYRDTWFSHGLGLMFRQFMEAEGVSRRMLRRPDGERRMTNLRHLGESLQQIQQQSLTPESALRWLQTQRQDAGADEAGQLRLESDSDLVQILTIHKSKGLEYPIVFCPYMWDAYQHSAGGMEGREYHDDNGELLVDFRIDDESEKKAKVAMRDESNAETLRLYYVALTRASHRCYLIAGPYSRKHGRGSNTNESCRGMLNWLVNASGTSSDVWHGHPVSPEQIRQSWDAWAAGSPHVLLRELEQVDTSSVARVTLRDKPLSARDASVFLKDDWRASSFSGLSRALGESQAADHDAHVASQSAPALRPVAQEPAELAELAEDDVLLFPRGTAAGECMHAAFEFADFTDGRGWADAAGRALHHFPQPTDKISPERQQTMLHKLLGDVLATELGHGVQLSQVGKRKRLTEMEFNFPSNGLRAADLNGLLREFGYAMPPLNFSKLDGFLKGFIDLVFEHEGKFYLLDWKSNHLGYRPEDYRQERLHEAMAEHGYYLQYLLYTVALDRYLRLRMPGYTYEQHFGGVFYLFVRGVRPAWQRQDASLGIYFDRPQWSCVEAFERLLGNTLDREAA